MRHLSRSIFGLVVALSLSGLAVAEDAQRTFVNPIYAGQDPYVMKGPDGAYYQAASINKDRGIAVYRSEGLTTRGIHRVVYRAPDEGKYRAEVWAPEIHYIDGKWYIYTCADDGKNAHHRSIVLEAEGDDPLGSYKIVAELDTSAWAIDATVSKFPNGKMYCVWSGWPVGVAPDSTQHLFLSEMESPTKLTGPVIDLSTKMYDWETVGRPSGLNEGAQFLHHDGKSMIFYAASGSWTPDYCLGLMTLEGDNPLDATAWTKQPQPFLSKANEVSGPGHGCMVSSPDGKEDWLVFHSSIDPNGSWNRCINLKKIDWNDKGLPVAGEPAGWNQPIAVPSGEPTLKAGGTISNAFDSLDHWDLLHFYNGNTIRLRDGLMQIRGDADARFGDKALLHGLAYEDFVLTSKVRIDAGQGSAGVLFRVETAGISRENFQGYQAAITSSGELVLSLCNGDQMETLQKKSVKVDEGTWYDLTVTAKGDAISVSLSGDADAKVAAKDGRYGSGRVGVRVEGVKGAFEGFSVMPAE